MVKQIAAGALLVVIIIFFCMVPQGTTVNPAMKDSSMSKDKATFAGGCFWCMEHDFEKLTGVHDVVSGYMGGTGEKPTYQDYAQKGYVEAIEVSYDSNIITYQKLLEHFWRTIDPTDKDGQFGDRGPQYRSVIYYQSDEQQTIAEASKKALAQSGRFDREIATEILPASTFYPAEEYHQDYAIKNPLRYKMYRYFSGRDAFLKKTWKDDKSARSDEELRKRLTPLQYKVTQQEGTEPPFKNEYWDNKRPGIYVDIVSGEPLFSSLDKYESGTGWPSFTQSLEPRNIQEREDRKLFRTRTEVRSTQGDSHLGHVFKGGPPPKGLSYCINSAALKFIPVEDLEKEGYGSYRDLFES